MPVYTIPPGTHMIEPASCWSWSGVMPHAAVVNWCASYQGLPEKASRAPNTPEPSAAPNRNRIDVPRRGETTATSAHPPRNSIPCSSTCRRTWRTPAS
jgi:hypothetical protein